MLEVKNSLSRKTLKDMGIKLALLTSIASVSLFFYIYSLQKDQTFNLLNQLSSDTLYKNSFIQKIENHFENTNMVYTSKNTKNKFFDNQWKSITDSKGYHFSSTIKPSKLSSEQKAQLVQTSQALIDASKDLINQNVKIIFTNKQYKFAINIKESDQEEILKTNIPNLETDRFQWNTKSVTLTNQKQYQIAYQTKKNNYQLVFLIPQYSLNFELTKNNSEISQFIISDGGRILTNSLETRSVKKSLTKAFSLQNESKGKGLAESPNFYFATSKLTNKGAAYYVFAYPKRLIWSNAIQVVMIICFMGLIFLIFLYFTLSKILERNITEPLNNFIEATKKVSNGDLEVELNFKAHMEDEIGLLSMNFLKMLVFIRTRDNRIQNALQNTQEMNNELKKAKESLEEKVQKRTTEIKSTNTELSHINSQLIKAQDKIKDNAHKAGMSEVASNILHNVGNILTSVNINADLLSKSMKEIQPSFEGINKILTEHEKDLSEFIKNSPKGQHLPEYILKVNEAFQTIFKQDQGRFKELKDNINYISEVIKIQQEYARVGDSERSCNIGQLIEEALSIIDEKINSFKVVVEFNSKKNGINVYASKVKLLNVFINLLINAIEAMINVDYDERKINIDLKIIEENIFISIKDKGMGFSKETKQKIFNHGFTTKKFGHGFGLHDCANAITQLGGEISAQSNGKNKGAEFIICLPRQIQKTSIRI